MRIFTNLVKPVLVLACTAFAFASLAQQRPEQRTVSFQKPEDNRFTPVVLAQDLDEPMVFEVTKDGKVYIAERKGGFKVYDPITEMTKVIDVIPTNIVYTNAAGNGGRAEEGLVGMTIDPNFETNRWVYLLYAHPSIKKHMLERWTLDENDNMIDGSNVEVLSYSVQRETCCHTGGGMTWDANGNLFIAVGNNTGNNQRMHSDERPGREPWDDQRGAASTNDLRGKILRIHPEPNGSYTIPAGNLFSPGTPNTRPEIYTMGHRNAWRPSIDSKTGFLYWGEVGPDASEDTEIGPRGYDELNQARGPGFFGWPYFVGENNAFPLFDYAANVPRDPKDPNKPMNLSVNNTGLKELPPAQPAFISYPYGPSDRFPEVGTGGRSAVGGPVYHRSDYPDAVRPWPEYYENKWIATDLARGWTMLITMNERGDYVSMEKILPGYSPVEPIDMKFGANGDLYILEYGSNWFTKSDNSQLVRIEYNGGNRTPLVEVKASKAGAALPAKITLSSEGTMDFDGDRLSYEWRVVPDGGGTPQVLSQASPTVTLNQPGTYTATLTVSDSKGSKNSKSVKIVAGNEQPVVSMNVTGNSSFYFPGKPINYTVEVSDKEDGTLSGGKISPSTVAISVDYASEGFDYAEVALGQTSVDASARYAVAQAIISNSDCKVCHQINTKSIGPMFTEIAERYKGDAKAMDSLSAKIRNGGGGKWGEAEVLMPSHPGLTDNDARVIVNYILNINENTLSTLSPKGTYTQQIPDGDNGRGSVVLRAAYSDKGASSAPSLTAENQIVLTAPMIGAGQAFSSSDGAVIEVNARSGTSSVTPINDSYIVFRKDLTGIKGVEISASLGGRGSSYPGGAIEIRLGSPKGALIGSVNIVPPPPNQGRGGAGGGGGFGRGGARGPTLQEIVAAGGNPFSSNGAAKTDIKATTGVKDIYLVFKNTTVLPKDQLMVFSSILFVN